MVASKARLTMFCDPYTLALAKRVELALLRRLLFLRSLRVMGPHKTSKGLTLDTTIVAPEN